LAQAEALGTVASLEPPDNEVGTAGSNSDDDPFRDV
jgi:hypothetical protein